MAGNHGFAPTDLAFMDLPLGRNAINNGEQGFHCQQQTGLHAI